MKEIEVLAEVYDDIDYVKKIFEKLNFKYEGLKKTVDEYYYDSLRDLLKPDANNQLNSCLRMRQKNNEYMITYKDDVFEDGKWLYSNELETKVESIDIIK